MRKLSVVLIICAIMLLTSAAQATFFNGFETDIAGWDAFGSGFHPTRVASGTNGIISASGNWHAESSASGSAGNWGGYNFGNAGPPYTFQEYYTSVDIFLDVNAGWANDTRSNFSSAINNSSGNHLRDFVFNFGFYNDDSGAGAGTNRFVFSASPNAGRTNSYPKNPGRDPISIATSGWYTLQHHFYDDAGVLAVDMSIFNTSNDLIHKWTLSDPSDLISGVGGNRYGWFASNEFNLLAFDNSLLNLGSPPSPGPGAPVPEPASMAIFGLGLAGMAAARWRKRNKS